MPDLVRMHVQPILTGSTAIFAFEGWNDAGDSATTALHFIDEAIRSVPLAEIDPENFYDFTVCRPEVVTEVESDTTVRTDTGEHFGEVGLDDSENQPEGESQGGTPPRPRRKICWPNNEFRYGAADAEREIVTYQGVEPHLKWRCFGDCITEVTKSIQVERVILLGSYLADVVYSQPVQVKGYASSPELLDELGISTPNYQGPTGILGVLGERFEEDGYEVVSLWAGLPHYINARPNPRGALALLQILGDFLDLQMDLEPMYSSAVEFEERISSLVARDPELSDYVKQLKRREFAQ